MPVIDGRLTCCQCGSDLGDAYDDYADPDCRECLNRELVDTTREEAIEERCDYPAYHSAGTCGCFVGGPDIHYEDW